MNLLNAEDVEVPESFSLAQGEQLSDFLFGVRPENLIYQDTKSDFSVRGSVTDVQYEGSVHLVHMVTLSGSALILSYSGDGGPAKGDEITVGWNRKTAHLFTKSDGVAVSMER